MINVDYHCGWSNRKWMLLKPHLRPLCLLNPTVHHNLDAVHRVPLRQVAVARASTRTMKPQPRHWSTHQAFRSCRWIVVFEHVLQPSIPQKKMRIGQVLLKLKYFWSDPFLVVFFAVSCIVFGIMIRMGWTPSLVLFFCGDECIKLHKSNDVITLW